MEIIFATHNQHKAKEIQAILPEGMKIVTLKDLQFTDEIPEPFHTLEENSLMKAETIRNEFSKSVIAEDTGLEVFALDNKPGVFSARYAGEYAGSEENMHKLLNDMEKISAREARFRTVLTYIQPDGEKYQFEGIVEGEIAREPRGNSGFGYDPIFIPKGFSKTFGEVGPAEKYQISHRTRAFQAFVEFLTKRYSGQSVQ